MLIFLVDTGKILYFICRNPFPFILPQSTHCCELQPPAVFLHGYIYSCATLVVLDNPSNLAVDAVHCANHLFPAVIARDFLDVLRDFISFPL